MGKHKFLVAAAALVVLITEVTLVIAQTGPAAGVPGVPATSQQNGTPRRGGFGFGLSLDLGTLFRAVQSLAGDEKYTSPEASKFPQYEPRQLILSWQADGEMQAQALITGAPGTTVVSNALPNLGMTIAVLNFPTQALADQALVQWLSAAPSVIVDRHAIQYPMQTAGSEPATAPKNKQYALDLVKAQSKTRVASAIVIGVVDTEIANPDALAAASYKAKRIFPESDKPASMDHGTGVALILAATKSDSGFQGLAQGAHIRSAGVMRETVPGVVATNTALVAQALDWLIGEKAQAINLSLGSAPDAVLAAVVAKTIGMGAVLIAAAGNGGGEAPPSYPAAYPGVIAATAVDANKQLYARANKGVYVAIAAPGVDVWVPIGAQGKGKYMSGTSFATPFVVAAVAQSLAQSLAQSPATAAAVNSASMVNRGPRILKSLCSSAIALGPSNPSPEFGCGLMQI